MHSIAQNFSALQQRIEAACARAGRDSADVTLIGVSKTKPVEAIAEAVALGLRHFGENYLDEAVDKVAHFAGQPLTWHYIGRIQSNKTRPIATHFDWVHTVDRAKIARRLSDQCPSEKTLNVMLQVNVDGDPAKAGVTPDGLPPLLEACQALPNLRLRGLMTILAKDTDPGDGYESVAQLAAAMVARLDADRRADWNALSMGMTGDLEYAIAAGATHIRIGTALFGAR